MPQRLHQSDDRGLLRFDLGSLAYIALGAVAGTTAASALKKKDCHISDWSLHDMEDQYANAGRSGWIPYFMEAGTKYHHRPEVLMALASRETNIRNIKGDFHDGEYHGFGIMQIDIGSYPDFISSGDWNDPRENILKGAEVLADKRDFISSHVGSHRTVGKRPKTLTYVGVTLTELGLLRTSIAAYNSGEWAYACISTYGDPDYHTANANYAADVINRLEVFDRLNGAIS